MLSVQSTVILISLVLQMQTINRNVDGTNIKILKWDVWFDLEVNNQPYNVE